ncbi:MAG: PQQ-binding-like beta-propeller repeat protein [Kiritimatiellia bacterium]|nr:PQQ-binding-like beta-propeller repeat protein [Kiritimatiellia bacterium]
MNSIGGAEIVQLFDPKRYMVLNIVLILFVSLLAVSADTAADIIKASGVQGGLVVHLGCGDGKITAGLCRNERYLVHGLDTNAGNVDQARKAIAAQRLNSKVSFDTWDGKKLPYADGLVNLIVVSDASVQVSGEELQRVLAPRGVGLFHKDLRSQVSALSPRSKGDWLAYAKPVPPDIDEWSHFLHDASNDAVSQDRQVGSPKRLRWLAEPKWCRSHELPSSVNGVVSSGGRIFTILDEGPTGVFKKLPQKYMLVARDAFSGVLLWKQPLRGWQLEHGTGMDNRWNIHHTIPRRLVAKGDYVYVTIGFLDSPVSVIDAATGEILVEALEGTEGADEIILSDDVLVVNMTKKRSTGATQAVQKEKLDNTLAAFDAKTGKQLWRKQGVRVLSYSLSAKDGSAAYHNMEEIVFLDLKSGKEKWRAPHETGSLRAGVVNLVISDGVVLFYGNRKVQKPAESSEKNPGEKKRRRSGGGIFLTAFSADDGKELWQCGARMAWAGACTQPADLFVIDGLVWCGTFEGRDLKTGEVKKKLTTDKLISPGHHYRCHRGKATIRYLILPKRGAEFVDVEGDNHMRNDWLRAPCFTGATPANGLFYVPTDQCFCYPGAKFNGYFALSAEPVAQLEPSTDAAVERGPAFGQESGVRSQESVEDWARYRHDIKLSGSTKTVVPAELTKGWEVSLSSRGSQPVVVGDRLWVAEKEWHRIRCLDANTGKDVWSFTAGGRITSSPTIHEGMALFGCRDGYVYCLRATDGELVWRFRAAPDARKIVSYEQVESIWPVHGSVLVQDGVVYFAAGRSSFLDGGIIVYGLEAKTGKVLYSHVLEGPWPDIKKDVGTPFAMEGSLNDLIVSDGKDLYLQQVKFDAKLNRLEAGKGSSLGELDMGVNHLVATGGFLDDTGYDRIFWMHGKRWPGFYLAQHSPKAGQLVVFDESTTYAVKYFYRRHQWSPLFIPNAQGYLLFADDNDNEPGFLDGKKTPGGMLDWLPKGAKTDGYRRGGRGVEKGTGYVRHKPEKWQTMIPLRIRAMVLAGDLLFAAGVPDVVDEKDPLAAFEGRKGGLLQVFSAKDGKLLKSQPLASEPAFDGMIAARGKLYISAIDGKVVCMSGK